MKKKHFFEIVVLWVLLAAGIQPAFAVHSIPSDTSIGTLAGGTFTLNTNVTGTIQIDASDLTLEGNGFTITPTSAEFTWGIYVLNKVNININNVKILENGDGQGYSTGIHIQSSTNINLTNSTISDCDGSDTTLGINIENSYGNTVTNCNISNNYFGIRLNLALSSDNTLSNNIVSDNFWGIHLRTGAYNNTLTGNQVSDNAGGIWLESADYNTLASNTVTDSDASGIYLSVQSGNNTLTGNISSNNRDGIFLNDSGGIDLLTGNILTGNTTSNNQYGIKLMNSSYNTMTNNTVSGNTLYGIWLDPSDYNQINNNNFIANATHAKVYDDCTGNVFNLALPIGGNHWSGWLSSAPYVFTGGQDGFPWTEPDGWLLPDTSPPEISCPGNITVEAMGPDGVPINDERIQTFLGGASATDDTDPLEDIIITNNAPALFPPGDTIVTFTATDTSDNTSTCQSTVTVVEAAESSLRIIPSIINREGRLENILAVIRFPEGTTVEDIDIDQPIILYPGNSPDDIEAINQRIVTWYWCGTLRVSVFACFSKDEVMAGVPENGPAEMMVIGRFENGQYFYGFDNVWICSWSW